MREDFQFDQKKSIKICGEKKSKKSHGFGDFDGYHLLGCSKLPTHLRTFRIRPELIVSNVFKSSHVGATHIQGDGLSSPRQLGQIHVEKCQEQWRKEHQHRMTCCLDALADWPPAAGAGSLGIGVTPPFPSVRLGVPCQVAGGCHILLQMWQGGRFLEWILGGFFWENFWDLNFPKGYGKVVQNGGER